MRKVIAALIGAIGVVLLIVLLLQAWRPPAATQQMPAGHPGVRSPFTAFDQKEAKASMDKGGDGMCDDCGMAVAECVAGGQLDCSMKSGIRMGILGTASGRVELTIEVAGKPVDLGKKNSAFVYPDKSGVVFKASDVALVFFLRSQGMNLTDAGLSVDGRTHKDVKLYVNDQETADAAGYRLVDGHKIRLVAQ